MPTRELLDLFDLHVVSTDGSWLKRAVEKTAEVFDAQRVTLFLREDQDTFRLAAQHGASEWSQQTVFVRSGEGTAGKAIVSGTPRLVQGSRRRAGIASGMILPLIAPSGLRVGVLNLTRMCGHPEFGDSDLEQAQELSAKLALAFENARSYAEVQAQKEHVDEVVRATDSALFWVAAGEAIKPLNELASAWLEGSSQLHLSLREAASSGATFVTVEPLGLLRISSKRVSNSAFLVTAVDLEEFDRYHRERERLERLAEIGQMTAAIAHEIRNPLTGIRAAAAYLRTQPDSVEEFAAIIEEECERLNDLCNEFLHFARPLELDLVPVGFADLVESVIIQVRPEFSEAGIALVFDCNADPSLACDGPRTRQVLLNLLRNAREATPQGGTVTVLLDEDALTIRDTGDGIQPELMERLFTAFATTKPSGTGLGLANVKRIVDAHGWSITADSTPGAGASFVIRFKRRLAA
ncbi:MAG: Adaptive-response sensory-kinase SasA [Fimbriimonadaceae bacterium]|nr:Adaptive-response sensory-kinase SasA [Fimbriimonadaceae bacterium]